MGPLRAFVFGATMPVRALRIVFTRPSLLSLAAIPFLVTLTLYVFVIHKAQLATKTLFLALLTKWGVAPDSWLGFLTQGFTWLLLLVVGVLTFTFVSSIVASPFNDFLAERAERFTEPVLLPVSGVSLGRRVRVIWIDIVKTIATLGLGLLALVVSWVPVLNAVSVVCFFLIVTFQYVSYPQTRRGLGLIQSLPFLKRNFFSCLGFGAVFSALFAIPFVSCVAMPLAVVGGTLLFARDPRVN